MIRFNLNEMVNGWFVGDFMPTSYRTKTAEVGYKVYKKEYKEAKHFHEQADEVTVVISGRARFNDQIVEKGEIVVVFRKEIVEFEALEDCETIVFKSGSFMGDKFIVK
jgi:oxalate decarboxylase/phosphoglucose isomerase-like protein (cupin superfamily)